MERTLALIKPDAVVRGIVPNIMMSIKFGGFRVAAMKMLKLSVEQAEEFYAEHKGRSYHDGNIKFVTSAPIVALVLEGNNAVSAWREHIGTTEPSEAKPGTIRAMFGTSAPRNVVHGSGSVQEAQQEIAYFFNESEIFTF